jgi:hypothetical protein
MEEKRLKLLSEIVIIRFEKYSKHTVWADSIFLMLKQVVHIVTY